MITISKKSFIVKEVDAETGHGILLGKAKNLIKAIEMAEKEMKKEYIEYGIHFTK
jgi:hypothetical protein